MCEPSEYEQTPALTQVAQADEGPCVGCREDDGDCCHLVPAQADETLAGLLLTHVLMGDYEGDDFECSCGEKCPAVEDGGDVEYTPRLAITEELRWHADHVAAALAAHVATIRAERESACANCGHVTDDVLSCWCACHRGACRICRRPEVEHRNRNGHGFIAAAAPPVSDQTEACVVCGHASGTAQPGLCPAHEYDDGPRTIRADAEQAGARALVEAATQMCALEANGEIEHNEGCEGEPECPKCVLLDCILIVTRQAGAKW